MRLRLIAIAILGALVLGGGYLGRDLITTGSGGGWSHEAGEVHDAERALTALFDRSQPNLTFVVEAREGDVDSRPVVSAALEFIDLLEQRPGITVISSYWTLGRAEWLRSEDGTIALVTARITGNTQDTAQRAGSVGSILRTVDDAITVTVGGEAILQADVQQSLRSTIVPLLIAAVLSLVLTFVFLRNAVATGLIGATAALAVSSSLIGAWGVSQFREVPVLSVVLGMAAAWSLATAGGLLVMSRFIAERKAGVGRREAVGVTVATAGRTVAIASVVAAAAGAGLWAMPTALLRSTGYTLGIAGMAAGVSTVIGLGIMLAIVGIQVVRADSGAAVVHGVRPLDRVSLAVRTRPVMAAVALVAVLGPLLLVVPSVEIGVPTPGSLAAGAPSRSVAQTIASTFGVDEAGAPFVLARSVVDIPGARDLTTTYAAGLSQIEGVVRVDSLEGSFVDGVPIEVPREVSRVFRGEDATWFNVPLAGSPTGPGAMETTRAMADTEAPYRVTVAGPAAREAATVAAIEGRLPYLVGFLVIVTTLLVAWLLHSLNAALRFLVMMMVMTAAAAVVIRFGFADGMLAGLLGFANGPSLPAVGPPIAWALSASLAATLLVFGWGSVREVFDARSDDPRAPAIALTATARVHTQAAAVLLVPFVPLLLTSWSVAKLIGAAALATIMLTATVGRVVAFPAFTGLAPHRLWPFDLEGKPRRVYASTPAMQQAIEEAEDLGLRPAPHPVVADAPRHEEDEPPPPDEPVPAPVGTRTPATDTVSPDPSGDVAAPVEEPAPALLGADTASTASDADEERAVEAIEPAEPAVEREEPAVVEPQEPAAGREEPDATEVPAASDDPDEAETVAEPEPVAEPEDDDVITAVTSPTVAPIVAQAQPATAVFAEPEIAEIETTPAAAPEEPDATKVPAAADDAAAAAGGEEPLPAVVDEGSGESGTVDVASLTASVIAALESRVPFTTEIGEAFVANPANNLSRVMEAILRDASQRGGDEVLVYGHASRDRYRWMVVDSGPSSDIDPDRARTLAEAQRFIRRVGGVVDCRPQGDFTVFVVEIPMAS